MTITSNTLQLSDYQLFYKQKRHAESENPAAPVLLLLHGAGVAGELTWLPIIKHLEHYSRILMPDLRGMGKSQPAKHQEQAFSIGQLVADVQALLIYEQVDVCHVVGYSLGGLISMELKRHNPDLVKSLLLFEPAMLERADMQLSKQIRQQYSDAAQMMRQTEDPILGVRFFMQAVSPVRNRPQAAQQTMERRLSARALGFSYALDAVTEHINDTDREHLLNQLADTCILSVVGERSKQAMQQYHQQLQQRFTHWQTQLMSGCDHSLVYQKPKKSAQIIEQFIKENHEHTDTAS